MNEFLSSVKADLLNRHRLPYLIALCVALVAVVAYGALAGGGSPGTPSATSNSPAETTTGGIAITPSSNATDASAEALTPATQTNPPGRNFFQPLAGSSAAGATTAAAATTTPSTSASAKSAGSASSPTPSSAGTSGSTTSPQKTSGSTPSSSTTPSKPSTPSKPKAKEKTYEVSLLFGVFSAPPAISQLTPYPNVKRGLQLPSPQVPLVTFSGWTTAGASATFTLSGEAIIHGPATCVPSPQQCTSITLKPGEAEQLQYVSTNGQTTTYELQVVSITLPGASASASSARAHGARAHAARHRHRHGY